MIGVLLVLTFAAVGIAAAPPLTFTFTDVIANKSALETDSYGINNAGTITGDYIDKHAIQHGMVLAGKKLTSFDYKKCAGGGITAYSINKAGAVAGSCLNKNGVYIGFTWDGAKFTDINFPKGIGTQVNGINDRGDVAGQYFDAKGVQHAFVKLVGGKFTSFDWKGHTGAAADGINNQGQIAGYAVNKSGGYEGFLKSGKTFKSMNNPNAGSTGTIVNN